MAENAPEKTPQEGAVVQKSGGAQKVFNVLGIILCVIFIPVIILNMVMIVRAYTQPDSIPSVFGYSPVIVLSGSMSPEFEAGDMIIIKKVDPYTLKEGDVICFIEEESAVTHRIIEVQNVSGGDVLYITQGDANNVEDSTPVVPAQVQGKYIDVHLSGMGDFAIFLQSTPGMMLFIGGPVLLFFLWDVFRRMIQSRGSKKAADAAEDKQRELEAELARLRAQVQQQGGDQQPPADPGQQPPTA